MGSGTENFLGLILPRRLRTLPLGWVLLSAEAEGVGEVVPTLQCKNIPGSMVFFGLLESVAETMTGLGAHD